MLIVIVVKLTISVQIHLKEEEKEAAENYHLDELRPRSKLRNSVRKSGCPYGHPQTLIRAFPYLILTQNCFLPLWLLLLPSFALLL